MSTLTLGKQQQSPDKTTFSPADYGVKGDGVKLTDVTTVAGSFIISSPSYAFGPGDVGKLITIAGAAAAAGVLNTVIKGVLRDGTASLLTAPSTGIAGAGVAFFGTDDTAAFNATVVAANAAGGGTIVLPKAIFIISSITWQSNVSMRGDGAGKSILKHIMVTDALVGMIYSSVNGLVDCQFARFECDMDAATAAGGYQVLAACIRISYGIRPLVERVYAHGSPATGLAIDGPIMGRIINNIVVNCGRLNVGNFGGAGIGLAVDTLVGVPSFEVCGNICAQNKNYGIFFEAESSNETVDANIICNNNVILMNSGSIAGIGDCGSRRFECIGNHILGTATGIGGGGGSGQNTGAGIAVTAGTLGFDPGNQGLIAHNVLTSIGGSAIALDYTVNIPAGQICGYVIHGNKIQAAGGHGIAITAPAAAALVGLLIEDNQIQACVATGITCTGAGGFTDLIIKGNTLFNNGTGNSGIAAVGVAIKGPVTRLHMMDNVIFDNGTGTQKFALGVNTSIAVTGAWIEGNDFQANNTGAISLIGGATIAGIIQNNNGYNPVGAGAVSPSASPYTYTAGNSPETLYIAASTSITALTQGGVSILPIATSANGQIAVSLDANAVLVVTYTGTLTAAKMVH